MNRGYRPDLGSPSNNVQFLDHRVGNKRAKTHLKSGKNLFFILFCSFRNAELPDSAPTSTRSPATWTDGSSLLGFGSSFCVFELCDLGKLINLSVPQFPQMKVEKAVVPYCLVGD